MKRPLLFLVTALVALAACDKKATTTTDDTQRQADERRLSELRNLEQKQAQRAADTRLESDRQRLAQDQASLEAERSRLDQEKAEVRDDAARLAQWREDEQKLARKEAYLREERERAANQRDQEQARADAKQEERAAEERKIDFFYSALDPLGDWMEVQPYGYVWQPREAQRGSWRPYTDGTWVYTDYGWTWKGNEPFGWATYHYGRWAQVRRVGWVWVPGSEWAPAWVSWRKSPDYIGWAPLPPEAHSGSGFNTGVDSYYDIGPAAYNFVPVASIGEPTYRDVVVKPEQNVIIVNQTVNITKINYTKVEQKTVIFNGGPDLQQINAGSSRPVPRLRLEREPEQGRVGAGTASNAIVGGVLRILAPSIVSAPRADATPARVKEHVAAPQIERGWGAGDASATATVRAKFRQEASQAEEQARQAPARDAQDAAKRPEPPVVSGQVPPSTPLRRVNREPATPAKPKQEQAPRALPGASPVGVAKSERKPAPATPASATPRAKPPIEPNRPEPRPEGTVPGEVEDRVTPSAPAADRPRRRADALPETQATPPPSAPVEAAPAEMPRSAPPTPTHPEPKADGGKVPRFPREQGIPTEKTRATPLPMQTSDAPGTSATDPAVPSPDAAASSSRKGGLDEKPRPASAADQSDPATMPAESTPPVKKRMPSGAMPKGFNKVPPAAGTEAQPPKAP